MCTKTSLIKYTKVLLPFQTILQGLIELKQYDNKNNF